jgi:hypothetical protein
MLEKHRIPLRIMPEDFHRKREMKEKSDTANNDTRQKEGKKSDCLRVMDSGKRVFHLSDNEYTVVIGVSSVSTRRVVGTSQLQEPSRNFYHVMR